MKRMNLNRIIVCAIVLVAVSMTGCRKNIEPQVSKGHLDTYQAFPSRYISPRMVRVWTPEDYDPSRRYDVLYMHDGQMLFDSCSSWNHQEWGVDETMDSLQSAGLIRPTIVVAVDCTKKRIGEYCPDDIREFMPAGKRIYSVFAARGNHYLRFVVEELKPFIDSMYATYPEREHTWIMGSSCGGLISSYALCKYPDVFSGAACMSTHSTLSLLRPDKPDSVVVSAYRAYLQRYLRPNEALLYMDNGDRTLDSFYGEAQHAINDMLRAEGWDSTHFEYRFFPGAAHTENDWKARLSTPLLFLLKP